MEIPALAHSPTVDPRHARQAAAPGPVTQWGGGYWTTRWAYLLVTLAAILLRLPTLTNNILSIDEAQYFAQAARLRSLEAFVYAFYYRIEVKSQIGLLPYMAAALDPLNAVFWDHLFGLGMVLVSCWLMIAISRRFVGNAWPGALAALLWLPYTLVGPGYAFAGHTVMEYYPAPKLEYFQLPFLLAAIYAVARALALSPSRMRPAAGWMIGAGLAWAMTVLIKPSSLLLGPAYVALLPLLIGQRDGRRATTRELVGLAGSFIGAAGGLIALVLGPYLWYPAALAELRFNLITTAGSYSEAGDANPVIRFLALLLSGMPPALLVLFLLGPFVAQRYLHAGSNRTSVIPLLVVTGPLLLLTSVAGCVCPHYYTPIIAMINLAVAVALAPVFQQLMAQPQRHRAWAAGLLLAGGSLAPQLPALWAFPGSALTDSYRADDLRRFDLTGLLTYIDTHSQAQQPIWVYYNTSEVYLWAQRPPATRDPQADWMTFTQTEPWFSRTTAELVADRPGLIIGIQQPLLARSAAQPLDRIPQVGAWIANHYQCNAQLIRGVTICTPTRGGR